MRGRYRGIGSGETVVATNIAVRAVSRTHLFRRRVDRTVFLSLYGKRPRSEPIDAAQDVSEQVSRDCDLRHLEGDIAPVAHDLAADLDQPVPERRQRPVPHGIRQGQGSQEVAEIVGKCVKLETDSIVGEPATGYRVLSISGVVNRIGPIPSNYTIG